MIKYVTLDDLNHAVRQNIHKIPHDVDFVVGVPRSGMLAATIIAEYLNLPLIDVEGLLAGLKPTGGDRLMFSYGKTPSNKVLVVDDTCYSGKAMNKVKSKLKGLNYEFIYAAVFGEADPGKKSVDIFLEDVSQYVNFFKGEVVLYEWNIFHHYDFIAGRCIYDIDGVLCIDPPDDRNVEEYEAYIKNATPRFTPTVKIGALCSYRIEKYREITQKWLEEHRIKYGQLIMFNADSWQQRNTSGISPEAMKASVYSRCDAILFVESSDYQARRIFEMTKKPVLSVEANKLYSC